MAEVTWSDLLRFVEARKPGTRAALTPPDPVGLQRLQDCAIATLAGPVPPAALEILETLGGGGEILAPFGRQCSTSLALLTEDLDEQVLAGRFFRVAVNCIPNDISPEDVYVDCAQTDGYDAPLIAFCEGVDGTGELPPERGHTIISMAASRIFSEFELDQRPTTGYAAIDDWNMTRLGLSWQDYAEAITMVAGKMDLIQVLRPRDDLVCYTSKELSIMFDAIGPSFREPGILVKVWIGTRDERALRTVVEQIRDWMPALPILDIWDIRALIERRI